MVATIDPLKKAGSKGNPRYGAGRRPRGHRGGTQAHPDVIIYTASIDEKLDENGIIPGPWATPATRSSVPSRRKPEHGRCLPGAALAPGAVRARRCVRRLGALVLMPLITGLDPNVALFTAGLGTLLFHW